MRANEGANPKGSKEGTKHERRTNASSHSRGRVADFNFVTQQNVELRITLAVVQKAIIFS